MTRALARPQLAIGTASVAAFLVAWQVASAIGLVRADFFSSPTGVAAAGFALARSGELGRHALVTLQEFVFGFVPAVAVGLAIGLLMGLRRRMRYLLDPLLMAFYTAPRIALIPVLVIWFGIGPESKIVVVFLSAVFPVIVNVIAGVQQLEPIWIRAARAFGASEAQVVRKIVLPGALPAVMAGVRLGLGRALIGVIVGEMYISVAGVGRLIQIYSGAGRTAELIALVTVIATFGFAAVTALRWWEERIGYRRQALEL